MARSINKAQLSSLNTGKSTAHHTLSKNASSQLPLVDNGLQLCMKVVIEILLIRIQRYILLDGSNEKKRERERESKFSDYNTIVVQQSNLLGTPNS